MRKSYPPSLSDTGSFIPLFRMKLTGKVDRNRSKKNEKIKSLNVVKSICGPSPLSNNKNNYNENYQENVSYLYKNILAFKNGVMKCRKKSSNAIKYLLF